MSNSSGLQSSLDRLAKLRALEDGWMDGEGTAPRAEALRSAESFVRQRPDIAGSCRIYPSPEGGVSLELDINGWDFSVDFLPDGRLEMHGIEVDGSDELAPTPFTGLTKEFQAFFSKQIARGFHAAAYRR